MLATVAVARGDRLVVERAIVPRLVFAATINVFVWMGLGTIALRWLTGGEGALLVYTMPIWAAVLAWPIRGERPTLRTVLALLLGASGVVVLLSGQSLAFGSAKLPGVACALAAAILFAFGTVVSRTPLPLPPLVSVAWQVGLGSLPMLLLGIAFEHPRLDALTGIGRAAMIYMVAVPMSLCYLTWFAALRRLPATSAATATLITPVIGVFASGIVLGEPLGAKQMLALVLTLSGVALALRKR